MRMEINQRTGENDSKIHNRISNMSRRVWGKHYFMLSWFDQRCVDIMEEVTQPGRGIGTNVRTLMT